MVKVTSCGMERKMRMWNIDTTKLCRKHLLGEHVEMHMFKGSIEKGHSIEGFIKNKLVNVGQIKKRHDEITKELFRRGFNHKSPMGLFNEGTTCNVIDVDFNKQDLMRRCEHCREMLK